MLKSAKLTKLSSIFIFFDSGIIVSKARLKFFNVLSKLCGYMSAYFAYFLFTTLMLLAVLVKGVNIVKENQRLVIFRCGRLRTTVGPGIVIIVPFIDMSIYVNLTKHISEWKSLDEKVIRERVQALVQGDPDPKKYQ